MVKLGEFIQGSSNGSNRHHVEDGVGSPDILQYASTIAAYDWGAYFARSAQPPGGVVVDWSTGGERGREVIQEVLQPSVIHRVEGRPFTYPDGQLFPNASVNAVFMINALGLLEDPRSKLKLTHAKLTPGGVLIATTPQIQRMNGRSHDLGKELIAQFDEVGFDTQVLAIDADEKARSAYLWMNSGFADVVRRMTPKHAGAIMQKFGLKSDEIARNHLWLSDEINPMTINLFAVGKKRV